MQVLPYGLHRRESEVQVNCQVCGKSMVRFKNPDRWICPNEGAHGRIEAAKRQTSGGARKGKRTARSMKNLKRKKK